MLVNPFVDLSAIERVWRPLSEVDAGASYFLSWPWVENWLSTLPPETAIEMLTVLGEGGEPLAACFLGRRNLWRSRLIPTRARFLNATGVDDFDEICVEHNGWVARPGWSLRQLVDAIPGSWDEVFLGAIDALPEGAPSLPRWPTRLQILSTRPCFIVDLEKVRAAKGGDYLSLLGGELRSQIRRSYKLYQARGPIEVEVAADLTRARDIYAELVRLHEIAWRGRGQAGAFALPYFRRFHERLIDRRFEAGEIQLVRIRAGGTTLGCLYNFVWRGSVSFYQSGVTYESDNRLKPGLVCHAEAVRHNAGVAGARVYDFLAGDARYKRGLSTDARTMTWAAVQRPRVRFLVEDVARTVARAWRLHSRARPKTEAGVADRAGARARSKPHAAAEGLA